MFHDKASYVDIQDEVKTSIDEKTRELVIKIHWIRQYDIATFEDLGWTEHKLKAIK